MEEKPTLTKIAIKRIIRDIQILNKSKDNLEKQGIYFHYPDDNIGNMKALIIGTDGTPYEGGFYFFDFEYPSEYPKYPPKVKFCSTDGNSRMNPNLYSKGKVCLSIINTWSGPGWLPTFTTDKVLIAIQAMVMNENPLINEPGFEDSDKKTLETYNSYVKHQNFELAIFKMLNRVPNGFKVFKNIIRNYFIQNFEKYRNNLLKINDETVDKVIKTPCYGIVLYPKYDLLFEKLEDTYENLTL